MTEPTEMHASPLAQWGTRLTAASVAVDHFTIQQLAFRNQVNLPGDPVES